MGEWIELYDSSEPVTDTTADVYETEIEINGTVVKAICDKNLSPGWNFYKTYPKGPIQLKSAKSPNTNPLLNFADSDTCYIAVWGGPGNAPPPTYYYQGDAQGSFALASDWSRTPDGLVPAVDRPIVGPTETPQKPNFANAIVFLSPQPNRGSV